MRVCNVCSEEKPLSEYHKAGNSSGHQYTCKPCAIARNREHYQANKARLREGMKGRVERIRAMVNGLKAHPCMDCGGTFPPVCMDFDHVEGEKFDGVSRMVRRGFSEDRILAEVAKCELVCANCHRIRTASRGENVAVALREAV